MISNNFIVICSKAMWLFLIWCVLFDIHVLYLFYANLCCLAALDGRPTSFLDDLGPSPSWNSEHFVLIFPICFADNDTDKRNGRWLKCYLICQIIENIGIRSDSIWLFRCVVGLTAAFLLSAKHTGKFWWVAIDLFLDNKEF